MNMHFNLEKLFDGKPVRNYRKQTIVFDCFNNTKGLNLIISGRIKVTAIGDNGQECIFNTLGPGNVFPLLSYFAPGPMPIYYTADTNVKSAYVGRAEADEYFHAHPEVLYGMLRDTLTLLYTRILTLSKNSAEERVLQRLIEMAERFGNKSDTDGRLELLMTQQELAGAVSLSRESVNVILKKMESKGVVKLMRNKMLVDIAKARAAS